ncbi:hypothetical protein Pmani_026142 [Petrolisthes manimaculis]|uniref:Uncharacterized protein n=1 Tax=Petrolisthes manimaculis TaxID=1843537 RepID=A0AAE1U0E4_9EUCA|nr:hypothetical protein Pmani_026142 [Petrolisthes manimaculis]
MIGAREGGKGGKRAPDKVNEKGGQKPMKCAGEGAREPTQRERSNRGLEKMVFESQLHEMCHVYVYVWLL